MGWRVQAGVFHVLRRRGGERRGAGGEAETAGAWGETGRLAPGPAHAGGWAIHSRRSHPTQAMPRVTALSTAPPSHCPPPPLPRGFPFSLLFLRMLGPRPPHTDLAPLNFPWAHKGPRHPPSCPPSHLRLQWLQPSTRWPTHAPGRKPSPPLPVKSSWSKADSRGGPKRFLEPCSSDCSFSVQLGTKRTRGAVLLFPCLLSPQGLCTCCLVWPPSSQFPLGPLLLLLRAQLRVVLPATPEAPHYQPSGSHFSLPSRHLLWFRQNT